MVMGSICVQLCLKVLSVLIVFKLIYFLNGSEIPGEPYLQKHDILTCENNK